MMLEDMDGNLIEEKTMSEIDPQDVLDYFNEQQQQTSAEGE